MASNSQISQHKRMAIGQKAFAKGGSTGSTNLKTGIKDSPLTVAKMNNGIPGMKKGGKAGGKGGC